MSKKYKLYTGVSRKVWNQVWKNKKLKDIVTNVTSDFDFAMDYSYDFQTGNYDDTVVEISNIPLDAFVAYRDSDYDDDDDFETMVGLSDRKKDNIINSNDLFILDLYPYRKEIKTRLLESESLTEDIKENSSFFSSLLEDF